MDKILTLKKLFALLSACALTLPVLAQTVETKPAEEQIARGFVMQHDGRMIFTPCRDRSYATVDDLSPNRAVTASLQELGLGAGKTLYVEFIGKSDHGTLSVSVVNFARTETRCQLGGGSDELWRAAGSNPTWTLVAGAGHLWLQREGKPEMKLSYAEIRTQDTTTQILTPERVGAEWRFQRQACQDQGAAMLFGWKAELTIDGTLLKGCAWQR
jgi:putative lipoprotein